MITTTQPRRRYRDLPECATDGECDVLMVDVTGRRFMVTRDYAEAVLSGHNAAPLSGEWWSHSPNAMYRIIPAKSDHTASQA